MQTFLPLAGFRRSAAVLDNKRLGKQRVECKQILLCLGVAVGEHAPGKSSWRNHPAVRMWLGYELQLAVYAAVMCQEWRCRGFKDTLYPQFIAAYHKRDAAGCGKKYPPWFGDPEFHASHRSNLLRKDYKHYSRFGWAEQSDLPYLWPTV
jgi:hypothetical protein